LAYSVNTNPQCHPRGVAVLRIVTVVLLLFAVVPLCISPARAATFADTLAFEIPSPTGRLLGWAGGPSGTLLLASTKLHTGRYAARIERDKSSESDFSSVTGSIPVTFTGDTLEIRGWLLIQDVSDFAGFWLREDGPAGVVQFDNMQSRGLKGTTPWTE